LKRKFYLAAFVCCLFVLSGCAIPHIGHSESADASGDASGDAFYMTQVSEEDALYMEEIRDEEGNLVSSPVFYISLEDVPSGCYCVAHDVSAGTIYYPLYDAAETFSSSQKDAEGPDPERLFWVKDDVDEMYIPTMYAGDRIIYKSSTVIPDKFYVERFKDGGYTIGIAGLQEDYSGHYSYDDSDTSLEPDSDTIPFENLEADTILLLKVGEQTLTVDNENVSESGTVLGLEKDVTYPSDVRVGTESLSAEFTANIHYFPSFETYVTAKYEFINEYVIELETPYYLSTGYYSINNYGYFRYLEAGQDASALIAEDYNSPYYIYDEDGDILCTADMMVIGKEGFLREPTQEELDEIYGVDGSYSYTQDGIYYYNVDASGDAKKEE
jgi:hypothetical protein